MNYWYSMRGVVGEGVIGCKIGGRFIGIDGRW